MRHARPAGMYSDVRVSVTLRTGKLLSYRWSTPFGLATAFHKAPTWAREEMKKQGVRGRSNVTYISVSVEMKKGNYAAP